MRLPCVVQEQTSFPVKMGRPMPVSTQNGPIAEQLAADGGVLFKWRSYMPLVLVPLFVFSVADSRPPTSRPWELFCFAVALTGLLIRAFVVGTAPQGTSARGTRQPTADSLSTRGAYSVVRHPLYLANTVIAAGCAMLSGTWYLPVIVLLLSVLYHERIAAREEAFLLSAFGTRFVEWSMRVPAMIPAFENYVPSGIPFQWRKIFVQEAHGLCAIGTAFLALDTIEDSMRARYLHVDPLWVAIFVATLVPLLLVVVSKRSARWIAQL